MKLLSSDYSLRGARDRGSRRDRSITGFWILIFCRGRCWWWRMLQVGRCIMLQFQENLSHPWKVSWFPRLRTLDHNNGRLLLLVFFPSLLYSWHLIRNELCNCFPVMLISIGMEPLLVGYKYLTHRIQGEKWIINAFAHCSVSKKSENKT